jgi:hypothetical protein
MSATNPSRLSLGWFLVLALAAASTAWAQLPQATSPLAGRPATPLQPTDTRILPQGRPLMPQRSLLSGSLDGNLLVTGNVRFGRQFRGPIGYTNPYAFRSRLQSSTLNTFRSGSVSYTDVLRGTVPLAPPVAYYPANTTILGLRDVVAGRTRPGTSQPRSSTVQPQRLGMPIDARLGADRQVSAEPTRPAAERLDSALYYKAPVRPGEPVTGWPLLRPEDRAASVLPTAEQPPLGTGRGYILPHDPRLGPVAVEPLGPVDATPKEGTALEGRVQPTPLPTAEPEAEKPAAPKGEDVFEDLQAIFKSQEPGDPQKTDLLAPQAPAAAAGEVQITTFAGKKRTPLNEYLRNGEELMKAGEYDRAAGMYRVAIVLNPDNPLPEQGRGHALLGQRLYGSAAFHLRRALVRFPELALVKMDLPSFYPSRPLFGAIVVDLKRKIDQAGAEADVDLRFMLGYAFFFSGRQSDAARHLMAALRQNPQDPAAKMLMGVIEKRSRRQPTTRPATP